jgi:hypothetical protein
MPQVGARRHIENTRDGLENGKYGVLNETVPTCRKDAL